VLDFATLNPWYTQTLQLFDTIFGFIFVLIGGIVLFTVSNTMTAAVVERTAEVGTVRAVGLRQSGVRRLFLAEGVLLGGAGALSGVVAALVISAAVNSMGLDWLPPGSSTPLPLTIRVWGEPGMIVGSTLGLVAVAAFSAWLPAWRAARLSIVDALRHA
jgi:putative ABC transport system permease protein